MEAITQQYVAVVLSHDVSVARLCLECSFDRYLFSDKSIISFIVGIVISDQSICRLCPASRLEPHSHNTLQLMQHVAAEASQSRRRSFQSLDYSFCSFVVYSTKFLSFSRPNVCRFHSCMKYIILLFTSIATDGRFIHASTFIFFRA